jgi:hypothetical protein
MGNRVQSRWSAPAYRMQRYSFKLAPAAIARRRRRPGLAVAARRQPVAPELTGLLTYDRVPVRRHWRNPWLTGVRSR